MSEIEEIKTLVNEKKLSYNEVSLILGRNRKTITKWANSKEYPKYKRIKQPTPVKENVIEYIKIWIEEDLEQIKKGKIRKIRTAIKMYDDLVEMGIKCSERSVRQYVSELKPHEVFIEQEYYPAIDMQVDWGGINLDFENNIRIRVYLFIATLPYSNTRFIYPYMKSDSFSFFDGHIKAFRFFGGVPKRIRYDNLSSAVQKVLRGSNRLEQDRMIYLKSFFHFQTNYCNVAKGNEKGCVENAVGFAKRRYLSGNKVFKDFDELRDHLSSKCLSELNNKHYRKGKTIKELLEEERLKFNPIPDEIFDNSQKVFSKVRSTSMIQFDSVRYSVPCEYVRKTVVISADNENIDIQFKDKVIVSYKREHKPFCKEVYNFRHFIPALRRKPRSLPTAKCIIQSDFPLIFNQYLDGLNTRMDNGNREMVDILSLHNKYDLKDIFFAMEWCYEHKSFSYDAILVTLKELTNETIKVEKINKAYPQTKDMPFDIKKYDILIGV